MFHCLLNTLCWNNTQEPENEPLLDVEPRPPITQTSSTSSFPPPSTILVAPKPRPSPLSNLPHHRGRHARNQSTISQGFGSTISQLQTPIHPSAPSNPDLSPVGGVGDSAGRHTISVEGVGEEEEGKERLGGISKFYSQRMRPLTRPSLPPTPAFSNTTHNRPGHTSYPNTPFQPHRSTHLLGSRTAPTSPITQLHTSPPHPDQSSHPSRPLSGQPRSFNPIQPLHTAPISLPHPRPPHPGQQQLARSVSAPTPSGDALTLHLLSKRTSATRPHPSPLTARRPAEIEGFGAHQLPRGSSTDPRSVMVFRGRPRSSTGASVIPTTATVGLGLQAALPLGGLGAMRSVSDEGVIRVGMGDGEPTSIRGLEGGGRRGRSPGLSRRSTLSSGVGCSGVRGGNVGSRTTSALGSRERNMRRESREGLMIPVDSNNPGSGGSTRDVSPDMSMDGVEGDRSPMRREGAGSGVGVVSVGSDLARREEEEVEEQVGGSRDVLEGGEGDERGIGQEEQEEGIVVMKDLGLADMFRPLGHRQSRSAGGRRGSSGGGGQSSGGTGRGSSRPGRGRRVTTG